MISQKYIKDLIDRSSITVTKFGVKTTVAHCILPNGYVISTTSSCVNPADYNQEIGRVNCMKRIEDKIWELEGYLQQQRRFDEAEPFLSEHQMDLFDNPSLT